jgi:hypothetical protein
MWQQGMGPLQPPPGPNGLFCQPGLEIRCSCGQGHWETTKCRPDGSNWEFCPCPEAEKLEVKAPERPSRRSTGVMASGIALTSIGAIAFGVSVGLKANEIAQCEDPEEPCPLAWMGLLSGGLLFTAVGIPLWVHGAARNWPDEVPRSTGMMVGGSLLAGVGLVAIAAGNTTLADGKPEGWAPVIMGTLGMAGGIALEVYGGWEVADVPEPESESDLFSRALRPEVTIGPGAASLRWTY